MDLAIQIENFHQLAKTIQLNSIDKNEDYPILWNLLKILRNMCAKSQEYQKAIMKDDTIRNFIKQLLFEITEETMTYENLKSMAWQLLNNATVGSAYTQQLFWAHFKDNIYHIIYKRGPQQLNASIDIILMIMLNTIETASGEVAATATAAEAKAKATTISCTEVLQAATFVWQCILQQQCQIKFEFLHILFEKYIVQGDSNDGSKYNVIFCYNELSSEHRSIFLNYLYQYITQNNPNGLVCSALLRYISIQFKLKSDCILRLSSSKEIERTKPQEAYSLLKCIATACGSECYTNIYHTDKSLFLNVGSLLKCLVTLCQSSNNRNNITNDIYKPLNKLEEVAPSGDVSRDYQQEITYELKTLLVRCIANLLYKNPTNKKYCLDIQLMPALLECTNMDARNPLMKEWSILAIRNACDDCPEIQEVIANLTQQGVAPNDLLNGLNLQMGSLRIAPSRNQ